VHLDAIDLEFELEVAHQALKGQRDAPRTGKAEHRRRVLDASHLDDAGTQLRT
jgi:hypothetical protein